MIYFVILTSFMIFFFIIHLYPYSWLKGQLCGWAHNLLIMVAYGYPKTGSSLGQELKLKSSLIRLTKQSCSQVYSLFLPLLWYSLFKCPTPFSFACFLFIALSGSAMITFSILRVGGAH